MCAGSPVLTSLPYLTHRYGEVVHLKVTHKAEGYVLSGNRAFPEFQDLLEFYRHHNVSTKVNTTLWPYAVAQEKDADDYTLVEHT